MPIELDPRKTAVVVIDMQNDVVHPDGVWGGPSGAAAHCVEQDAIAHIGQITAAARKAGSRVFFVHHAPSVGAVGRRRLRAERRPVARHPRDGRPLQRVGPRADRRHRPRERRHGAHKQRGNAFTQHEPGRQAARPRRRARHPARRLDEHGRRVDGPVGADIGYEMAIVSDATVTINAEWQHAALSYGVTVFADIPTTAEVLSAFGA